MPPNKTPLDGFPMPQVHEILEYLYSAAFFRTLDLRSGLLAGGDKPRKYHKNSF